VRADVVQCDDVGMLEDRSGARFLHEAAAAVVGEHAGREGFERDEPAKPRVFGFPDRAHPALADFLEDLVVAEMLARLHEFNRV